MPFLQVCLCLFHSCTLCQKRLKDGKAGLDQISRSLYLSASALLDTRYFWFLTKFCSTPMPFLTNLATIKPVTQLMPSLKKMWDRVLQNTQKMQLRNKSENLSLKQRQASNKESKTSSIQTNASQRGWKALWESKETMLLMRSRTKSTYLCRMPKLSL